LFHGLINTQGRGKRVSGLLIGEETNICRWVARALGLCIIFFCFTHGCIKTAKKFKSADGTISLRHPPVVFGTKLADVFDLTVSATLDAKEFHTS
jgi:hypothetical protein